MDKVIEKWLKERKEDELFSLYAITKDEQIRSKFSYLAFQWAASKCSELLDLKSSILSTLDYDDADKSKLLLKLKDVTTAQIDYILEFKKSNICIKCKNPIVGILKKSFRKSELNVYPIEYLFLSIYEYSGLCIDCIGKFLLEYINKLNLDS